MGSADVKGRPTGRPFLRQDAELAVYGRTSVPQHTRSPSGQAAYSTSCLPAALPFSLPQFAVYKTASVLNHVLPCAPIRPNENIHAMLQQVRGNCSLPVYDKADILTLKLTFKSANPQLHGLPIALCP